MKLKIFIAGFFVVVCFYSLLLGNFSKEAKAMPPPNLETIETKLKLQIDKSKDNLLSSLNDKEVANKLIFD